MTHGNYKGKRRRRMEKATQPSRKGLYATRRAMVKKIREDETFSVSLSTRHIVNL